MAGRLGGLGNRGVEIIRAADATLDLSGGDSFTDLYGPKRFWGVGLPKLIALEQNTPLVLPPQTYGPFSSPHLQRVAARIVRGAAHCWARDPHSLEVLRRLLGDVSDPARCSLGVDVAFGLERRKPLTSLSSEVDRWLEDGAGPVVGLNVSGLVYLDPQRGRRDYGFRADYRAVIQGLLQRLLEESDARVVLVPHVLAPVGHFESDREACQRVLAGLGEVARDRVALLEGEYAVTEVKHLISRLDWFCGTRMHSTIAALSSGVPAAAVAYSPKFRGVFEVLDQSAGVADPTDAGTAAVVESLLVAYNRREEARGRLNAALPTVLESARVQADELVAACTHRESTTAYA
jgi:colanic acid/amylovoran biosynthesis protein